MRCGTRWVAPGCGETVATLREVLEQADDDGRGEGRTALEITDRNHLQPYDLVRMNIALASVERAGRFFSSAGESGLVVE